ncbi:MAG: DUF2079 domain-containing protein [Candidatus Komeilibacteria bacterium]|nr:DUF2079 domain-containing protein [Candidatus Komeilibacteria bacterium]
MPTLKPRAPLLVLAVSVILYLVVFITLVFWKYNHFYYDNLDLAIFNNVFYNTLHGNWFAASIHSPSYLGDHFSPLIILLLPFYAFAPRPETLLVFQTLIISATAFPIYYVTRMLVGADKKWLACGIALLWIVNPSVHNMNFFEFELTPFAVFFLFWTVYGYLKENTHLFVAASLLALAAREDVAFILFCMGLVAWIQKKKPFWIWYPLVAATAYALLAFLTIQYFAPAGSYKFLIYYGWLGGTTVPGITFSFIRHPLLVLQHLVNIKNIEFVLGITFPFFFLVIVPSAFWLLLLPPALQVMLSAQGGSALILNTHYAGFFLFGLFLVFIQRMRALDAGKLPKRFSAYIPTKKLWYLLIAGASVYAALTYGSVVPAVRAWRDERQSDVKRTFVSQVPASAPVAATFELLPAFSSRQSVYSFHYAMIGKNQFAQSDYDLPADTQFLAIDWQDILKAEMHFKDHYNFGPFAAEVPERLQKILDSFSIIDASGSLMLMHRTPDASYTAPLTLTDKTIPQQNAADPILNEAAPLDGGSLLTWSLPANHDNKDHYYLEITTEFRTFLIPFGYGRTTPATWDDATTLSMPIYLSDDEYEITITLYRWTKGFLKLGELKNLTIESDAEIVDSQVISRDIP